MNIKIIFASLLLGVLASCSCDSNKEQKTNIIFIMSDDHAYQAISAYGSDLLETPNIDRLAEQGMLFNRAFVANSICSPSRATLLTGKFSHLNSVKDNIDVFDSSQVTFPKILQQNGYQTAIIGKWHLKSEPTGFDYWKVLPGQGNYYHPEFRTPKGIETIKGYVTDITTELAIEYLDSIRNKETPFMLMVHNKAPHRQWWPAMEDIGMFEGHEFPVPANLHDDYKNMGTAAKEAEMRIIDHMGITLDTKINPNNLQDPENEEFYKWYGNEYIIRYNRLSDDEKLKWDAVYGPINEDFKNNTPKGKALTLWKYQRYMEDYLGTIVSVDRNVGRLLDYLEENGLIENTMIVYTSDQGFYLGEHGWFDKRFMYEESYRTPLIVSYPGVIEANTKNNDLVQNIDFAPTFLDLAGVEAPEDMQGKSLIPIFKGDNENWRDALYYHYYEYPGIHGVKRHYGVRTDRYKLIHFYYDVEEWEMYDLEKDPNEMTNIYNNPEYKDIQESLHKRLDELRVQYKDSEELDKMFIESDFKRLEL
jgi:arylsulfatase A-like enzyme